MYGDRFKEPKLSSSAIITLQKRYLAKNEKGEIYETPRDLFFRVAKAIAEADTDINSWEKTEQEDVREDLINSFYSMMVEGKFLPNSPTLMNAGRRLGQLAACFVLPIEDSIEGIFDAIKYAAMIHKSGGGTGFSFSRLRPANSEVGSTGGIASGPVSFLKVFDSATEQIKQGGTRRGANMGILRVDHPDILDFIRCKEVDGKISNFNLSVGITDEFMEAVKEGKKYDLINPVGNGVTGTLDAKEVFDLIVEKAWQSGEPGIIFLDKINKDNPTPSMGTIEATNPCGEQPLLPYEACNLGSINLSKFYNPSVVKQIDYKELRRTVRLAVRFLDNVIDASKYPLPEIDKNVKANRKIGLGVMGWADLLYKMKIPYNSEEALALARTIMGFIQGEGWQISKDLASTRGEFYNWEFSKFFYEDIKVRNATVTTIAPTGTLSIIANCSSGIEPLFALAFTKNILDGEQLVEFNPVLKEVLEERGLFTKDIIKQIQEKGSIQDIKEIPEDIRNVFVTAMDIEPKWHLLMQDAFQAHTDNAVSKTINLPNSATKEDVALIYNMAYQFSCKGVTVYRDGSRASQVLTINAPKTKEGRIIPGPVERPEKITGFTQKIATGLGQMYLTVNEVDGRPFEVFVTIGKSGKSITAKAEAIGRLVSLALRSGIEVEDIVRQIKGIGGEHPVFQHEGLVLSIPDAIGRVLEENYIAKENKVEENNAGLSTTCPECGGELVFQEGCVHCKDCDYSKCS